MSMYIYPARVRYRLTALRTIANSIKNIHDRLARREQGASIENMRGFSDLPHELQALVLAHVDCKTIFEMRRVNKDFYQIVQCNMVRIATPSVHSWRESVHLVKRLRDLDDISIKTSPTEPWIAHDNHASPTVLWWCIDSAPFATGAQLHLQEGLHHPRVVDITFKYPKSEASPSNSAMHHWSSGCCTYATILSHLQADGERNYPRQDRHNLEVLVGGLLWRVIELERVPLKSKAYSQDIIVIRMYLHV
jgi:hypothetical protein